MRRIIFENVFQDYEFLDRKEKLFNFLYSIGMDSNSDTSYSDINKDGENDTLMVHFNMGSVTVYVGLCNFSNGEFKYLLYVKSSDGIVLKPTFFDSVEEIEKNVSPYIETAYDDTKLSYLGIENEKEYVPSKSEYNDMLNSAIDSKDWEEVRRIQNKYGKLYESIKKIIRLTESDITNIVNRTIMELNKSTYDSAARVADERGFKRLSNKFSEYGKEFGYVPPNTILNLVFNAIPSEGPIEGTDIRTEFKVIDIQRDGDLENSFIITLGSLKSHSTNKLYVNKSGRNIDFLLSDRFECLPEKRKDSKLILKLLTEQGVDVSDVDLRSITYEDSGF